MRSSDAIERPTPTLRLVRPAQRAPRRTRVAPGGRRAKDAHRDRRGSGNAPRPACKPSPRGALVRTIGNRRGSHVRELQHPKLRAFGAGGGWGQPRLLHSEPALAGPEAEGPAAGRPAKARRLLRAAFALASHSAARRTCRMAGRLPFARKPAPGRLFTLDACPADRDRLLSQVLTTPALTRIFLPRCPEIPLTQSACLFDFISSNATNKKCGTCLSKGRRSDEARFDRWVE